MPVQLTPAHPRAELAPKGTEALKNLSILSPPKPSYELNGQEKTKLEEILDMCADYERQIEEEQNEALRLRQNNNKGSIGSISHNGTNGSGCNGGWAMRLLEHQHNRNQSILNHGKYESGGQMSTASPNMCTPTSPTGLQWSPGGTMLTPNR